MEGGSSDFDIAALRAIGWTRWNPIGLAGPPKTPADEYDPYLVAAARLLADGSSIEQARDYLCRIETERMGLSPRSDAAAANTAVAIRAYLDGRPA